MTRALRILSGQFKLLQNSAVWKVKRYGALPVLDISMSLRGHLISESTSLSKIVQRFSGGSLWQLLVAKLAMAASTDVSWLIALAYRFSKIPGLSIMLRNTSTSVTRQLGFWFWRKSFPTSYSVTGYHTYSARWCDVILLKIWIFW